MIQIPHFVIRKIIEYLTIREYLSNESQFRDVFFRSFDNIYIELIHNKYNELKDIKTLQDLFTKYNKRYYDVYIYDGIAQIKIYDNVIIRFKLYKEEGDRKRIKIINKIFNIKCAKKECNICNKTKS